MNNSTKLAINGLFAKKKGFIITKTFNKRSHDRSCCTIPTTSFDMKREKKEFLSALPIIVDNLAKHSKFDEVPIAREWIRKVINGTVTGGKLTRGLTTVLSYKTVEKPEDMTEEAIRLAQILGWCTEFLQAYFVILDDIVDGSLTRRGQPCWHLRADVGMAHAVNDASIVYASLVQILRDNFENSPIYVKLSQIFNEHLFYVSIGQFLDIRGSQFKKNANLFTIENYDAIVKQKCSYYTYALPVSLGLMIANRLNEGTLKTCEEISFQLGRQLQMLDDVTDCFGDESQTGKKGTDIQEGKCTWLAVNALSRCNAKNRTVFLACYGSKEPAHIERIKQLYIQLEIPELYKQKEREINNIIIDKIKSIPSAPERALYRKLLDMIYDRKKNITLLY